MLNRRGNRKPSFVGYPCVWCIFGFVIGVCLCLVTFSTWQQGASRTSTVQVGFVNTGITRKLICIVGGCLHMQRTCSTLSSAACMVA
jgi:hypothetical protein